MTTRGIALTALSLTFGLVQLDATIVNVALESVRADLGGGVARTQWLVDAYAVPFAALLLAAGALGDRRGHRRTCLAGFAVFGLASAPAALATGWGVLIAARAAQGVGAALMLPASLALVGRLYPEPRSRSRALGVWGGLATLGFASGPLVGGVLVTGFGWPAVFWVNLPLAVLVAITIAVTAPADRPHARAADRLGALLGALTLGALVGAIVEAGQGDLGAAAALVVLAVTAGAGLVRTERRTPSPLLPAQVAYSTALRSILVTGFGFNFAMYGALLCTSLVLQQAFGLSPLAGGLAVLPMALVVFAGSTTSGYVAARTGPRAPMLIGLALGVPGVLLLGIAGFVGAVWPLVVGLAVCGLVSFAMPAMTSVALTAVPEHHAGLAGGALNATRQTGGALGVAVLGALLNAGGYGSGLLAAGLTAALALVLAMLAAARATREVAAHPVALWEKVRA